MKNLHLYAVSMLVSYWIFSSIDNINIWTFVVPIIITKGYLWAQENEDGL